MSTAQYNAGQARGNAQAKTEEWVQSAQNTANSAQNATNRACDNVADSRDTAQQEREQNPGFLQQTGEQVMHMAQGAIDGVKNTLGVGAPHGSQGAQTAQEALPAAQDKK
ncbi:late embryogenesis abundant protein 1-like [Cornus florida]|uniref:late embryogenesis abundant protein 1-like n=1 Tax=Cornus florida TaxID=4283 RepID=UPI002898E192|nr:late embryogenesis abundant protein 1-like [Cornus florida]